MVVFWALFVAAVKSLRTCAAARTIPWALAPDLINKVSLWYPMRAPCMCGVTRDPRAALGRRAAHGISGWLHVEVQLYMLHGILLSIEGHCAKPQTRKSVYMHVH